AGVDEVAVDVRALKLPEAQLRRIGSRRDLPTRGSDVTAELTIDVSDVALRVHADIDAREGVAGDAGIAGDPRIDEDIAVVRRVGGHDVGAGATDGPDLGVVEINGSSSPHVVDVAGDEGVVHVNATVGEQGVLQAQKIDVAYHAHIATLQAQSLGLRSALRRQ